MTPDKAITWLTREGFTNWTLYRGDDEKVSNYDSDDESPESGIARFADIIDLQMPGKYKLKGYTGKSKQASAMTFLFDVKAEPVQRNLPVQSNNSPAQDLESIFLKARQSALEEMKEVKWREDIIARFEKLEKRVEEVAESVLDLSDNDEENNETAIDRLNKGMAQVPALAKGIQGMKGLFTS